MQLHPYLTFNGNCREAMIFYQQCLGGKLHLQTVGAAASHGGMTEQMAACILHATLKTDGFQLDATDISPETGRLAGNAMSIMLQCESAVQAYETYEKLARGGIQKQPVAKTIWGGLLGDLTDRYGHQWLVAFLGSAAPPAGKQSGAASGQDR